MTTPYTPGPGDQPPAFAYPPPAPPRRRTGRIVAFVIAGVLALCGIGVVAAIAAGGDPARDNQLAQQDDANRAAAGATSSPPAAGTSAAAPGKSTPAEVRVPAGTYTVGDDIPAGRYKVAERADADCYWQVTGTGGDIVDNGVGGGFPTFTAKRQQQVETFGCPEFVLQRK